MKDILLFLSDQHSPVFSAFGGGRARTPHLDALCRSGTDFQNCYTPCPLCVPARMSLLSGRLPSHNGVMLNLDALSDLTPTFLHPFAAAGYDTVLIGRMHFVGRDQRHGFTKRIAPDITPVTWNRPTEKLKEERGVFNGAYDARGCVRVIGGGESPVLRYDDAVTQAALDYLSRPHERPQLIVVGTYAPHFPYVAPKELYREYRAGAELPLFFHETPDYMNPILKARKNVMDEETVLAAQAAYLGMITCTDSLVGRVRQAFDAFTEARGSESLFCYLSDHGDQAGQRDIFGKCTFFEASARVPMIMAGSGIPRGTKVTAPCTLMDLGPTLCSWAGVEHLPGEEGTDLLSPGGAPAGRFIESQLLEREDGRFRCALMLRKDRWKYMVYSGYEDRDVLFDLESDPDETRNAITEEREAADMFRRYAREHFDFEIIERQQTDRRRIISWIRSWEKLAGEDDSERWKDNPDSAKQYPEIRGVINEHIVPAYP